VYATAELVAIFDFFFLSHLSLPRPFSRRPSATATAHRRRRRRSLSDPVNRGRLISTPKRRRFVSFIVECGCV
jgi:hypothetical protein